MKQIKRILCAFISVAMCLCLFGCDSDDNNSSKEEAKSTEKTYNLNTQYEFMDISLNISDEWECEETSDSCTVSCPEDNSFMYVQVYNMSGTSDPQEIYESFSSSEKCHDISKLMEYEDYPLYTFSFTQDSIGSVENYFFIHNELIYFISVPQTSNGEDSIIYDNLSLIILPVKVMLMVD